MACINDRQTVFARGNSRVVRDIAADKGIEACFCGRCDVVLSAAGDKPYLLYWPAGIEKPHAGIQARGYVMRQLASAHFSVGSDDSAE